MDTKCCSKCGEDKPITEFAFKHSRKDIRRADCKVCFREISKAHYNNNKKRYKVNRGNRKYLHRDRLQELKKNPCTDCGNRFHYCVMDFDHVKGTKIGTISALVTKVGWDRVAEEIAKCDLVCANCHRLRTYNRIYGLIV